MVNLITMLRNRLSVQMVAWSVAISMVALGVVTYFNYWSAKKELDFLVSANLEATSQRQTSEIKSYLRGQEMFVTALSLTSNVVRSLDALNEVGEEDGSQFEGLRKSFAPVLKGIVDQFGFRQMYLISIDGKINMSIGDDLANYSNLNDGPLSKTQLGEVFRRTIMLLTPQISDFEMHQSKEMVFYLASPVLSEGKLLGVIALQSNVSKIYDVTQNYTGLGQTGETILGAEIDGKFVILNPIRHKVDGRTGNGFVIDKGSAALSYALLGKSGSGEAVDYRGKVVLAAWEYLPKMRWGLVVKQDKDETLLPVMELRRLSIMVEIVTLIIVLTVAIFISRSITNPVISLTRVAERIARGDLTPSVSEGPSNEVGLLAKAIGTMARNLKSLVNQVKSSGSQVGATIDEVSTAALQQEIAAKETGSASLDITASARKISVTAKELTGTMQEVNEVAQDTALLAESGEGGLKVMRESMDDLSEANQVVSGELRVIQEKADVISGIINTMTKVADQTNLLSLNAAIEARKAGEAGRGFRVVSEEIRRLANQAAVSTLEIENMIDDMLEAVRKGVFAMNNLSQKINYGAKQISTVSTHLRNVIQQVQGLPPRFDTVLQGMKSQSERADDIKGSIAKLNQSAQKMVASLEITRKKLGLLGKTAGDMQGEIAKFQT